MTDTDETEPLPSPSELRARLPLSDEARAGVYRARSEIRRILHGEDRERFVVIVGPCSIHDPAAALEYAARLSAVAAATRDRLVVVMRTYLEKPRTTLGWKGLLNDPRLDGSCDLAAGLSIARRLLLDVASLGLPCAAELLDPSTHQYVGDCLAWAAIGARTAASQTHREMASGLPIPVGFKNATDGSLEVAVHAIAAAGAPHTRLGIGRDGVAAVFRTRGNSDVHLVLRGGTGRTNYAPEDIERALALLGASAPARPILVDCSHGNSAKDPSRQGPVCREVLRQARAGQRRIMGFLVESNLQPGSQPWRGSAELEYGVSITDPCIGWPETEALLFEIADAMQKSDRAA